MSLINRFLNSAPLLALTVLAPAIGHAQESESIEVPEINIIGVTPMPGTGISTDKIPTKVQSFNPGQYNENYSIDLPALLNSKAASIDTSDTQSNPFQKNLTYRGFQASPLLGEPQGLAVYQNGVRVNEPFGDVMQWDLIPEAAISRAEVISSNPIFGLNSLGGAIVLGLKNGFEFSGVNLDINGGYFERGGAQFQLGHNTEHVAIYTALEQQFEAGWRNRSPSDIKRAYANIALRYDNVDVTWDFTHADNDLRGAGLAPAELLEENRRAVFTWPDITDNSLFSTALNANYYVNDTVSLQANTYFRRLIRTTFNGDEVDAQACEIDDDRNSNTVDANIRTSAASGDILTAAPQAASTISAVSFQLGNFVCEEEEASNKIEILLDADGQPITAFASVFGAANTSSTMTKGWGASVQTTVDNNIFGRDNKFIVGGSADYGLTRFHNESFLATLPADRTLLEANPLTIINFASLELEFANNPGSGDGLDDVEQEFGEQGPTNLQAHNRYYGLYATDTFYVNDGLAITLGSRFNFAHITTSDEFRTNFSVTRKGDLNGSHVFRRINPSAGFTYKLPISDTTFYANWAQSNRAPSPVELSCADPAVPCRVPNAFTADPPLSQVISQGFETGIRGYIHRKYLDGITPVKWSLNAYSFENKNDIIFISAGVGLGTGFFKNVGKTKRTGFDTSLSGKIVGISWATSYAFLEPTYETTFQIASANHPQAINKEITVKPGDNIPGLPQHSFKVGGTYEPIRNWTIGLDMLSKTGVYARGDEANLLKRTSGHTIFNFSSNYKINDRADIYLAIDNIFDTNYENFAQLGETGNDVPIYELPGGIVDPTFLSPGQPFAAFAGLKIKLN